MRSALTVSTAALLAVAGSCWPRPAVAAPDHWFCPIARFDNQQRTLLGIFHKPSGTHIGLFTAYVSRSGRTVLWNVLIGERSYRGAGGLLELKQLRVAVGNFFFVEREFAAAIASVVAHNAAMIAYLKNSGWELAKPAPDHVRSARDGSPIQVLTFRLTREQYLRRYGSWSAAMIRRDEGAGTRSAV